MGRHLRADLRSTSSLCGRELDAKELEQSVLALNARGLSGPAGFTVCRECLGVMRRVETTLGAVQQ